MMLDRTSDDSGLTSDDTWERKTDLMTQSASVVYKDDSLKHLKKPGFLSQFSIETSVV